MTLSRVELFELIRRDRRLDPQVSLRTLAERYGVHRRTVRAAIESAMPPARKKPVRSRTRVLAPAMGWIDAMLREDVKAPRKQRHTVRRIYDRLVVEHDFDQVSYSTVCDYVQWRRAEILAEPREGRVHLEGTVPQLHAPGAEAEVDFADVWVRLAGEPVQCHLFTLRCRTPVRQCIASTFPRVRKRSCRATWKRSRSWAGCPRATSVTTT